jgi:hypothetical protein
MNGRPPEEVLEVALKFVECINRQDLDALSEMLTDDHRFRDLAGDEEQGKMNLAKGWGDYFSISPTYLIHVAELYLSGEQVVILGRTTGSHTQQPRQEEIRDTLLWVATVQGDQISAWELYLNTEPNRQRFNVNETTRWTHT